MKLVSVAFALIVAACGSGSKPRPLPPDTSDAPESLDPPPWGPTPPSAPETSSSRTLGAGHRDARYAFVVPTGFVRVQGVSDHWPNPRMAEDQGAVGVGLPGERPVALSSIGVFSDPLGVGFDWRSADAELRRKTKEAFNEFLRHRFPAATPVIEVDVGPHRALRSDLPRVEMKDRPLRAGRTYLVFDGVATVSVDCLWIEAKAEQLSAACDAVVASLRRQ